MQHKWLKRRCEAAAAKAGGSSPSVLARVFACCGRFLELLHPEGAERMECLRQAEAAAESAPKSKADAMDSDAGLGAMRAAIAATEAVATVPPASTHLALAQPIPRFGDAGRKQVAHLAINRRGLCVLLQRSRIPIGMVRTRVAGRNPASKRLHELSWPGPSGQLSLAECDSLAGGEPLIPACLSYVDTSRPAISSVGSKP